MNKQKNISIRVVLAQGSLILMLLAGANAAQAATVIFGDGGTKATAVLDLNVDGRLYNVTFDPQQFAFEQFGSFPGTFVPFTTGLEALAALVAMIDALNNDGATTIGEVGGPEFISFAIGYDSFLAPIGDIKTVSYTRSVNEDPGDLWQNFGENDNLYIGQELNWVVFQPVPVPATVWLFGSALGLLGWLRRKSA